MAKCHSMETYRLGTSFPHLVGRVRLSQVPHLSLKLTHILLEFYLLICRYKLHDKAILVSVP